MKRFGILLLALAFASGFSAPGFANNNLGSSSMIAEQSSTGGMFMGMSTTAILAGVVFLAVALEISGALDSDDAVEPPAPPPPPPPPPPAHTPASH